VLTVYPAVSWAPRVRAHEFLFDFDEILRSRLGHEIDFCVQLLRCGVFCVAEYLLTYLLTFIQCLFIFIFLASTTVRSSF